MSAAIDETAELFRVLGHPLRLSILHVLVDRERSVGELAQTTGIPMSALSQQLAILRKAEVVQTRRDAKQIFYAIAPGTLARAQAELAALCPAMAEVARPPALSAPVGAAMLARMRPQGSEQSGKVQDARA